MMLSFQSRLNIITWKGLVALAAIVLPQIAIADKTENYEAIKDYMEEEALNKVRVLVTLDLAEDLTDSERKTQIKQKANQLLKTLQKKKITAQQYKIIRKLTHIPVLGMNVSSSALRALNTISLVKDLEFDLDLSASLVEVAEDLRVNQVTHATSGTSYTGLGQAIAIIDTGVDANHPFLAGKVAAEACYSSGDKSLCPNRKATQLGVGAAKPCTIESVCDHGTHVAGIAAGKDVSKGLYGIALDAEVIAYQVVTKNAGSAYGIQVIDILAALDNVYELHQKFSITAVNMSLGTSTTYEGDCSESFVALTTAVELLTAANVAVIAAAGNEYALDGLSAPACIPSVISVGAIDKNGTIVSYSNVADDDTLDLLAIGGNGDSGAETDQNAKGGVLSAIPGDQYEYISGTSMAAPAIAGAVTLLKQANPLAPVATLVQAMQTTGTQIPIQTETDKAVLQTLAEFFATVTEADVSSLNSQTAEFMEALLFDMENLLDEGEITEGEYFAVLVAADDLQLLIALLVEAYDAETVIGVLGELIEDLNNAQLATKPLLQLDAALASLI